MYNILYKHFHGFIKLSQINDGKMELSTVAVQFLSTFFIWTDNNNKLYNKLRFAIAFCIAHIGPLGLLGHSLKYISITDNFEFSEIAIDVSIVVSCFAGFHFIPLFYLNQPRARKLLEELGNFKEYAKPRNIEIHDGVLNTLIKYTNLGVFAIAPIMFAIFIFDDCTDDELDFSCGLAFASYIPGLMSPIGRKITLTIQVGAGWPLGVTGFTGILLHLQISEFIVLYLNELIIMIKNLRYVDRWTERHENVRDIIRYHHRILELFDEYYDLAKNVFVIYAVWIPIILGIMSYGLMENFRIQSFGFFFLWTISLFVACWFGQRMIVTCSEVVKEAYDSIPLDGDLLTAKYLCLLILRSQRDLYIPAGSLTYCGYELFVNVAQSTYSYLTLLRSTSDTN